jgi:hypothetical protein
MTSAKELLAEAYWALLLRKLEAREQKLDVEESLDIPLLKKRFRLAYFACYNAGVDPVPICLGLIKELWFPPRDVMIKHT